MFVTWWSMVWFFDDCRKLQVWFSDNEHIHTYLHPLSCHWGWVRFGDDDGKLPLSHTVSDTIAHLTCFGFEYYCPFIAFHIWYYCEVVWSMFVRFDNDEGNVQSSLEPHFMILVLAFLAPIACFGFWSCCPFALFEIWNYYELVPTLFLSFEAGLGSKMMRDMSNLSLSHISWY